ncbi:MAG: tetratricopeptide repeat protein [Cyanobacteria bacterium SID2]|nr:tetratricopeptide repeat protein [Cyanobacteria bacterium SID2]
MSIRTMFIKTLQIAIGTLALALATGFGIPKVAVRAERESAETLSPQSETLFLEGIEQFERGNYVRAEQVFSQLIEVEPQLPEAYYNRARSREALQQYDRAIEDYSTAVRLRPEYTAAYINRGNVYWTSATSADDIAAALSDFDRAIELEPSAPIPYLNRGNVYAMLGDLQRALDDYDRAIELEPDYVEAHYNRALTLSELGQIEAALASYANALDAVPAEAPAYAIPIYLNRGMLWLEQSEPYAAIEDFERVLSIDANNPEAYGNRGLAYVSLGNREQAIEDFQRAATLFDRQERPQAAQLAREAIQYLQQN